MSYNIYRTNGSALLENGLPDNLIDNNTVPVGLIGKLTANYGEAQSTNFLHLMEHFANETPPKNKDGVENSIKGLIWFRTTDNTVHICINENPIEWKKFAFIQDVKPSDPDTGDIFYDSDKHQLSVYDDNWGDWVKIGPTDVKDLIEGTGEIETDSTQTFIYNIPITNMTTDNVEIRLVGREIIPEDYLGLRQPEVGSWNIQCLVSSYNVQSGTEEGSISLDLINQPFVQKIASTNNADKWTIDLATDNGNSTLQIKINAAGIKQRDGSGGKVKWKIYYKIVKVED